MRFQFFASGLVDEVAARGTLEVERVGDARYVLRVRGENEIDVAMWTTCRSRIVARPWPDPPSWLTLACGPDDVLESLRAEESASFTWSTCTEGSTTSGSPETARRRGRCCSAARGTSRRACSHTRWVRRSAAQMTHSAVVGAISFAA